MLIVGCNGSVGSSQCAPIRRLPKIGASSKVGASRPTLSRRTEGTVALGHALEQLCYHRKKNMTGFVVKQYVTGNLEGIFEVT